MKGIILVVFMFIYGNCIAQNKKDNVIIANGVSFKQVVNGLLDKGFKIDKIDSNYNTVRTEWKEPFSKYTFMVYYDIRVKDSSAFITGHSKSLNMVFDIEYGKSGLDKYGFAAMNDFAKFLSSNVSYARQ